MSARLPVTGCTLHIPGIFTSFFLPARALGLTRPAQLWHFSLQREPHTHNWPANAARRHRASQCWRSRAAPAEPESTEPLDTAQAAERLYSTLDPKTLAHQPGSVFGCAALVAGTTVGAGILALPYTTEGAGFVASSTGLVGAALYMIVSGLLVAEVNINTMCALGSGGSSLTSMAERTLGSAGALLTTLCYFFLHYAMIVAYMSKGGDTISALTGLPQVATSAAFSLVLGAGCAFLAPKALDKANTVLVGLVIASFLGLLAAAAGGVNPTALQQANWREVPHALPTITLSFVFHNVVPVIATQLEGDIRKVRTAIVAGVGVPLIMFLSWDAAILGSLGSLKAASGAGGVRDPLKLLASGNATVGPLIQVFSFLAVATSLIGFILGLTDFISDNLKLPAQKRQLLPYAIALLPPFVLQLFFKDLFFSALDYAGTYGVLVLFGVIPAAMAWQERYGDVELMSRTQIVPGGRPVVIGMGAVATAIIANEAVGSLQQLLHS